MTRLESLAAARDLISVGAVVRLMHSRLDQHEILGERGAVYSAVQD